MHFSFRSSSIAALAAAWLLIGSSAQGAPAYTVAVGSLGPSNTDLYVAGPDGNGAKPFLPGAGQDYNGSFSNDGKWVFFTSDRAGTADIYRARADGSGLERLTDNAAFDDQASLSPNGKTLSFVSDRGGVAQIWLLDMASRAVKPLTQGPLGNFRPMWSPDGEWIAYSSQREPLLAPPDHLSSNEIHIIRADGSGMRRVSMPDVFSGSPAWSRDGKALAFYETSREEALQIINPRGGGATQIVTVVLATGGRQTLTTGPGHKFSPRWLKGRIAYVTAGENGGLDFSVGAPGARGEFQSPMWSADERRVIFHRETDPAWPPVKPLQSLDPEFGLTRAGIFASYAPDGKRVVSVNGVGSSRTDGLLIMDADGSNRTPLFSAPDKSALAPVWSPRGDWIAFGLGSFFQGVFGGVSDPQTRRGADIALIRPDGSGFRQLTNDGGASGFPAWSPDGKRLVYRALGATGKGLLIVDIETGETHRLTTGPQNDTLPDWSSTDVIAFASDRDGDFEIYSIKPDGSDLKRLTRTLGNDAHGAWSPDGAWYAFSSARGGLKDEEVLHPRNPQPFGDVYVMRADGTDVRRLNNDQYEDGPVGWVRQVEAR